MNVSQRDLDELRSRLERTRWPAAWPASGWEAGTEREERQRLVAYWSGDFDWRAQEAAISALPSAVADIGGAAGVSSLLAEAHPQAVSGLHLRAVADPVDVNEATLTDAEQAYREPRSSGHCADRAAQRGGEHGRTAGPPR